MNQYQLKSAEPITTPDGQQIVTFTKTIRRIEQEGKVMSESYDQIFEKVKQESRPYD